MASELDLSFVIPIFNENENLPQLTGEIRETLLPLGLAYELLLVNDASTDGSLKTMLDLAAENPRIRILSFEKGSGQSAALMAGFRAAKGKVVVTLDGDLQNDPADIPRVLRALDGNALVSGIRANRQDNWLRKLSSRVANHVRRAFVGDSITDVGCSLKAYQREWLVDLPSFKGLHRFLPGLLEHRGAKVAQVQVNHRPRIHGESKYGLHNRFWRGIADMMGVCWLQSRWTGNSSIREISETSPLRLVGAPEASAAPLQRKTAARRRNASARPAAMEAVR